MASSLPHYPIGRDPVHLTYRLAGSIPDRTLEELADGKSRHVERFAAEYASLLGTPAEEFYHQGHRKIQALYERAIDDALHSAERAAPYYLSEPEVATIVLDSWHFLSATKRVSLWAVCVMGNHVHAIVSAGEAETTNPARLMEDHKGFTARMANRKLGRTGQAFWAPGYYDRRIRKRATQRVFWYVLNNPVKAGLVDRWTDWPFTWIHPELRPMYDGVIPDFSDDRLVCY